MKKNKITKKKIIMSAVLFVIAGGGGFFLYNNFRQSQAQEAFAAAMANAVTVETVERSELKEILTATGTVALEKENIVLAENAGKIAEILVEEGDVIEAGQQIVRYDVEETLKELEKSLLEEEINLSNQQLSLQSLTLPATDKEIDTMESAVTTAERNTDTKQREIDKAQESYDTSLSKIEEYKITLNKLQKEMADNEILLAAGGISGADYEDSVDAYNNAVTTMRDYETELANNLRSIENAQTDLMNAEADLTDAEEELADAGKVLTEEEERINYEKQQNQIKLSELNIAEIKEDIAELQEYGLSTVAGTISTVHIAESDVVEKDAQLITVADFSNLVVKADISEYDAADLALGQKVDMYSDGIEDVIYEGEIIKINPVASSVSTSGGTETVISIEVSVTNPDSILRPGYNLDMDIVLIDKQDIINIPIAALQKDKETDEQYVFVVDDARTVHKTVVTLGLYGDMNVEVTEGLTEGQRIVAAPDSSLTDGAEIMIAEAGMIRPSGSEEAAGGGFMMPMGGGSGGGRRLSGGSSGPR